MGGAVVDGAVVGGAVVGGAVVDGAVGCRWFLLAAGALGKARAAIDLLDVVSVPGAWSFRCRALAGAE